MTNKQVARALKETAALIELTGGNPFRARAYQQAARAVERLEEPVAERLARQGLKDLPGIGAGLEEQIRQLLLRGSFDVRDELLNAVPPGLLELLHVKGLGPKKVRTLWQDLGITSLDALEGAARRGHLSALTGFGARTQQKLIEQIALQRRYRTRRRLAEVLPVLDTLCASLDALPSVRAVSVAGEARRRMETIASGEIVVAGNDTDALRALLSDHVRDLEETTDEDGAVLSGQILEGLPLRLILCSPEAYGTVLWKRTGAQAHCREYLDRYGPPPPTPREDSIYARAGLAYLPPEVREGKGELEAASDGTFPTLIEESDLRGTLHNHSTYSDGAHTLRQMAEAAYERGYEYFGICDHSRSLRVAHGLEIEDVLRQHAEIDTLNHQFAARSRPFRIFKGIESDILADGSLDYPDEVLTSFDLVVASIHTGFNMTREAATERLIKAIANPFTTILGHPTGRLLLAREGYPIDHAAVIEACARYGVAIELNANPYRLDLDWRWIRYATERGVLISINPDAHAIEQLDLVRWGVAVARKGWLTREQCLNARPLQSFSAWLDSRRKLHKD